MRLVERRIRDLEILTARQLRDQENMGVMLARLTADEIREYEAYAMIACPDGRNWDLEKLSDDDFDRLAAIVRRARGQEERPWH